MPKTQLKPFGETGNRTTNIMSTTQGVFSETLLQNMRIAADKIMFDSVIKNDYLPRTEALKALFDNQIAKLNMVFSNKKKDYTAEVWWTNACELAAQECTTCEFGGNELSTNIETYELDYCKEVPFTVTESTFITNEADFAETLAKGILRSKKILSEDFTGYVVGLLNTYSGANALTTGIGTVSGNNTYIPSSAWTANAISYFQRVAEYNQLTNPFVLSGANLHQAYLNAVMGIKPEDVGRAFGMLPLYFDEYNIDRTNTPSLITYLISKSAYAIGNKAYSPSATPVYITGDLVRYLERDEILPLEYDVFIKKSCYEDFSQLDVKVKLKAGFYKNPSGCGDSTGILNFVCGEAS